MGTRSTYRVIEEWSDEKDGVVIEKGQNKLVLVYLQFDGYPTGHPMDTAEWLSTGKVVNGLSMAETQLVFNGAGCLAAQLVERLKDGPGGCYIHPLAHRGKCWENYTYDIIVKEDKTIEFIAYEIGGGSKKTSFKKLFAGSPEDFIAKFKEEEVNV